MRSSALSVPKLPQGMARMKNSRKPSEHGLRLFAPITCFVVKKRITSVPHRRSVRSSIAFLIASLRIFES